MMLRYLFLLPILAIFFIPVYFLFLKPPPPLPDLPLDEWWGPESQKAKPNEYVKPFRIKFKNDMIQDLKDRIKNTRTPAPPLEGVKHEYGFNSNDLQEWLTYWGEEYNFAERLNFLNQYQHYRTNIQGLNIHFIHVKADVPAEVELVPILLLHGWPGSVREFYEAIPYLASVQDGRDFALELIIPSLPGYGFSDAAVRPGLGAAEVAVVMRNLMQRLGFSKYYVQGGDAGAIIGSIMATMFPKEVQGFHSNMALSWSLRSTAFEFLGAIYTPLVVSNDLADRMYPLSKLHPFLIQETGYMHIQATKPDTIGVAFTGSPSALLAYVLEKFATWTDHNQRPITDHFTKDQMIDNLMMYWINNCMTTAMRLYAETVNKRHFGLKLDDIPTPVPTWALQTKYELAYQPPFILKQKFPNLVNATVLQDGGHFIALEKPKVFATDVIHAVTEFRKINKNPKTEL